jgi:hypothetical protein
MNMRGMGCALYIRCTLSIHEKECQKSLGCYSEGAKMTNNKGNKGIFHDQLTVGTFGYALVFVESCWFVCSSFSCQVICTFMKVLFFSIKTSSLGLQHRYVVSIRVLLILCH